MPVMGAPDSRPHTQVPYLSGAAGPSTLSAERSAGKPKGLARSSGLRLGAAEPRKNSG